MVMQRYTTYDTKRISLVTNLMQRSGLLPNKDARLVNMMVEFIPDQVEQKIKTMIRSRPGVSSVYTLMGGAPRGIYYWLYNSSEYVFSVVDNLIYRGDSVVGTLATSIGQIGFTEFVNDLGVVTLVLVDGTNGYVFATPTSAPVQITDANFPSPHLPDPIFMDGYLFLAKSSTQDVYNSNLNNPAVWTAGDFLSAEMYPDKLVALTKNNNYIYAVGSNSIEYMYDAATSTGTPLGRNASAVIQFGTPAPQTVVQTEKEVILVGATANGGHTVWTIDGFKPTEIATQAVKLALLAEGAALPNAVAYCIRVSGQKLYILNLTSRSFVYSFDTQMWCEWASGTASTTCFIGHQGTDGPNGQAYLLDHMGQYVYAITPEVFTDNGVAFRCEVVSARADFDTMDRKFLSRLVLIGDTIPTGTTFSIEWCDDDYDTWTAARTLSFDNDFPMITQLGSCRRRAHRVRYSSPYLVRLEGLEIDINKGSQ